MVDLSCGVYVRTIGSKKETIYSFLFLHIIRIVITASENSYCSSCFSHSINCSSSVIPSKPLIKILIFALPPLFAMPAVFKFSIRFTEAFVFVSPDAVRLWFGDYSVTHHNLQGISPAPLRASYPSDQRGSLGNLWASRARCTAAAGVGRMSRAHHPIQRLPHVAIDVTFNLLCSTEFLQVRGKRCWAIAVMHQPANVLPCYPIIVLQNLHEFGRDG